MKIPHIRCALCGGPVEQQDMQEDPAATAGSIRIRVRCHGASEVQTLDIRWIVERWTIVEAVAFRDAPLTKEMFR